jgi:hypothetical protein
MRNISPRINQAAFALNKIFPSATRQSASQVIRKQASLTCSNACHDPCHMACANSNIRINHWHCRCAEIKHKRLP